MPRRVNEIQRNSEERRERPKVHPYFTVNNHRLMPDRLNVDIDITAQEMLRL